MVGTSLAEQQFTKEIVPTYFSVKEAVFPFNKFPSVDPILGGNEIHRRSDGLR